MEIVHLDLGISTVELVRKSLTPYPLKTDEITALEIEKRVGFREVTEK